MSYETILKLTANTIRGLSIDAIETAGCGHPGLPMGCAEIMAVLYGRHLKHNPKNSTWLGRDRFILSAGHGSMALYSALFLAGFNVSKKQLTEFRKLGSPCAGHPEYGELEGVETTTGPLGQGIATATGMALGQQILAARYASKDLFVSRVIALAGDGCMMEGISSEAGSLAGHLGLGNLTLIYDANDICLDGPINETLSEDTAKRYEAYGWHVQTIDGHNFEAIEAALKQADNQTKKPSLIIAKTKIGKGSPNREGTSEAHGKALGKEETELTKKNLNIPLDPLFYVPEEVSQFFESKLNDDNQNEEQWNASFKTWSAAHPKQAQDLQASLNKTLSSDELQHLKTLDLPQGKATRSTSGIMLNALADTFPYFLGGSADLSCSDNTYLKSHGLVGRGQFDGKNIKFGVREFAMGAMCTGLALTGGILPYCGTFLTFSDYMRNAIRLAALMNVKVVYQFTHDSILLGEDGPTHQPVEHVASLRAMPNLTVIRPCDEEEVRGAWLAALSVQGPVALILSRQNLPSIETSSADAVAKGAYIIKKESGDTANLVLLATGSEISLALDVAESMENRGLSVRVVSLPSFELFDLQSDDYKNEILGNASLTCSIEALTSFGWHKYIGKDGVAISVDTFGQSAPASDLAEKYGFTVDAIVKKLEIKTAVQSV